MTTVLQAMVGVILLLSAFVAGVAVGLTRGQRAVARWLHRYGCWSCQQKCEDLRLWRDEDD